jgi:hypothetical protein
VREHWYDGEEADGDGDRIRVGDGRGFMVEICDCDNLLVVPLVGENGYGRKATKL